MIGYLRTTERESIFFIFKKKVFCGIKIPLILSGDSFNPQFILHKFNIPSLTFTPFALLTPADPEV